PGAVSAHECSPGGMTLKATFTAENAVKVAFRDIT
ncbi:MAG: hypothetical protein QOI21_1601, partial [Actinomycetota bacterium]|nr:hypothetical protein [Actinomycetota bacterium]